MDGRLRQFGLVLGAILVALVVLAIGYVATHQANSYTFDDLVKDLRSEGLQVELPSEPARDKGWFPVPPRRISVNGEFLEVYEFADIEEALKAARAVSPRGTSIAPIDGTSGWQIDWSYPPPSWYQKGQLIVIYGGTNSADKSKVERVLGTPFARG
jgi:hypothetical protein